MALALCAALPAGAQVPGEFVVGRDVPVRNAVIPGPPGNYIGVQMKPDMSVMDQVFGPDGIGGGAPITDEAAAGITSSTTANDGAAAPAAGPAEGLGAADQYQFAGGSMESRSGLGGSIVGAVNTGLAPLMSVSRILGGGQ